MTTKQAVLELLERNIGKPISGEEIGNVLNITRSAVWKTINSLKSQGYQILSTTNKGYTLEEQNDLLSKNIILEHMVNKDFYSDIIVLDTVGSTNDYAKSLAVETSSNVIVVAEHQTAGKGRLGRNFASPANSGIYLSFLMRPNIPTSDSGLITSYVAVAVCQAIYDVLGVQCQIKWVNDLYTGGKKVCGILTEGSINFELSTLQYAVIGIGINVFNPKDGFGSELSDIVATLTDEQNKSYRNKIIAKIADNLIDMENTITQRGFLEYYRQHSYLLGKDIFIIKGDSRTSATAIDIDRNAGLIVKLQDGSLTTITSGEVSIRLRS